MEKTDTNEEQRDVRGPARGAVRGQRGTGERQGCAAPSRGNRNGKPGRWTPVQMHVF